MGPADIFVARGRPLTEWLIIHLLGEAPLERDEAPAFCAASSLTNVFLELVSSSGEPDCGSARRALDWHAQAG